MIVVGVLMTVNSVTYGSLIFAHPVLANAVTPDGVVVWLLSTLGAQVAASIMSGSDTTVGGPALEMIPIFYAVFSRVAEEMPGASTDEVLGTCLAVIFLATVSLGVLLVCGAKLGLTRYLRAVPLVVLKGALFGVALFLLQSAVTSTAVPGDMLAEWPHWGIAVVLGTLLFAVDDLWHSPAADAAFLVGIALGPQVLQLAGMATLDGMRASGWLFPEPLESMHLPWYRQLFAVYSDTVPRAAWGVALQQTPAVMGLWLTHTLCSLMDLKAVELLTQKEIDLDIEFVAIGFGNILSALLGGGWPVYMPCSPNVTIHKLGGRSRAVGVVALASTLPAIFMAQTLVPCLPRALPGCVTWWLGLVFMKETLVDILRQHTHSFDVLVVAAMAVLIMTVGFLDGLFVGLLMATAIFTVQYSGSPAVVRAVSDVRYFRSNVVRPLAHHAALDRLGHRISVVHVDGYLMFGSSPHLVDVVRPLLAAQGPEWVVLNFRGLRGLDYSAVLDLAALGRRAAASSRSLVLAELRGATLSALERAGLRPSAVLDDGSSPGPGLCAVEHYHQALKCCEDALLRAAGFRAGDAPQGLASTEASAEMLRSVLGEFLDDDAAALHALANYFDTVEYPPGSTVFEAGSPAEFFVGVVHGQLHVLQPTAEHGVQPFLLEILVPGGFVGVVAVFNEIPFTTSAVVPAGGEPCTVLVMRRGQYAALCAEQPRTALAFLRSFMRRMGYEYRELARAASL